MKDRYIFLIVFVTTITLAIISGWRSGMNYSQAEINRILNEPLVVESVTRYLERIDENTSEEVYIWTVCNVKCYELKRKHNIAIGVELEVKR